MHSGKSEPDEKRESHVGGAPRLPEERERRTEPTEKRALRGEPAFLPPGLRARDRSHDGNLKLFVASV